MFDSNYYLATYETSKPNSFVINLRDSVEAKLAGDERNKDNFPYNHIINLRDSVEAKLAGDERNKNNFPYDNIINLYDRSTGTATWGLPQENLNEHTKTIQKPKLISVQLNDGIRTTSPTNDDDRIIQIKNNIERLTTWEGIFPSERTKNNTKSVYKTIQDDELLKSSKQNNQESNGEQIILQNVGSNVFVVNLTDGIEGSFGGENRIREDKINHNYIVPRNIAAEYQHVPNNPESIIEVSFSEEAQKLIGEVIENGNQALFLLVVPLAGIVIIRTENERTRFYQINLFYLG